MFPSVPGNQAVPTSESIIAELQALFMAMDDLVLIRDATGRCLRILTPAAKLLYRSPEQMLGSTLHETLPLPVADQLLHGIQATLHSRTTVKCEYQLTIADHLYWFDANLSPIDTERVLLVIRDITDRKQLELDQEQTLSILDQQAAQLRLTLELNQIGCWEWDLVTGKIIWDERFSRLLGLDHQTVQYTYAEWHDRVHPDDITRIKQNLAQTLAQQQDIRNEYRVIHPDGSIHWIAGMGAGTYDEAGTPIHFLGIVEDITDRKAAELALQNLNVELNRQVQAQTQDIKTSQTALQQREQELSNLVENIPDSIFRVDRDLCYTFINTAAAAKMGCRPEALIGKSIYDRNLPPAAIAFFEAHLCTVFDQAETLSISFRDPVPPENRYFQSKLVPEFNAQGEVETILVISRDITDLKQTELALRQSEARFRKLFEASPIAIGLARTQDGQMMQVNPAYATMLGYSHEELLSMSFFDYTHADDLGYDLAHVQRLLNGEISTFQMEKRLFRKTGEIIWAKLTATLLRSLEQDQDYTMGLIEDITDRKRVEAALHQRMQREQLLHLMTQQIHQSLNLDTILTITVANVREILVADRVLVLRLQGEQLAEVVKEAVGEGHSTIQHDDWDCFKLLPQCYNLYQQGIPQIISDITRDEYVLRPPAILQAANIKSKLIAPIVQIHEQTSYLWGLLVVHACTIQREWQPDEAELLLQIANQLAIAIQQATLYQQVQTDLQERQAVEVSLRNLLQEKEILLKEVHHRVKNNLQVISSLLRMQARRVDAPTRQLFEDTYSRVQSIAIIHEHLYQSADLVHIDFGNYIRVLVNHLFHSYGKSSDKIKTTIAIEPINLNLNHAISCGLIINELVSNALKYAFVKQDRGEILIQLTRDHTVDFSQNQAVLIIRDNGVGISSDFNWQTCPSLGLRIVHNLVEQMNGTITFESTQGTTVIIRFIVKFDE